MERNIGSSTDSVVVQFWPQNKNIRKASPTLKKSPTAKYLKGQVRLEPRCPFRIVEKYLSHLNPNCSNLFQRPRTCDSPLGHNSLEQMMRKMTTQAGVDPCLTNHCLRATSITVLNSFCGGSTYHSGYWPQKCGDHQAILRPANVPTVPWDVAHSRQLCIDENTASSSIATANPSSSNAFPPALSASLAPPATTQVPAVSSTANLTIGVNYSNQLLRVLIPGCTFTSCQFTFNLNSGPTKNE